MVVERIGRSVTGAATFTHHQGCGQTPVDLVRVNRALVGLGRNPNLAGVLLVGLGCEGVAFEEVAEEIRACGTRVESLVIQEEGGQA